MATPFNSSVPTSPFLDASTGDISQAWRAFLVQLLNRTGGTVGVSSAVGRNASFVVPVTASPFTYVATLPGTLFVSNGGVMGMTLSRGGNTPARIGNFYDGISMYTSDVLTITYSRAPALAFFPG